MRIRAGLFGSALLMMLFVAGANQLTAQTVTWEWGGLSRGFITIGSDGNLYISSYFSGLSRTSDNGASWRSISGNSLPSLLNRDLRQIAVNSSGHIFVGTSGNGGIFRSTNGGTSWDSVYNLVTRTIKVAPNGDVWAAGYLNTIYYSSNNGQTWTARGTGLLSNDFFDLEVVSSDTIFVAASNGIYRTTNRGVSWASFSNGLLSGRTACLGNNVNGYLFAGAWDNGRLYRSTNRGENWTEMTINPRPRNVVDMVFTANGYGFAATDSGVYQSTDNGINWQNLMADIRSSPFAYAEAVGISTNGYLFVSFASGAVVRSVNPISAVRENGYLPPSFELSQNYPNPFNPSTTIEYEVPRRGEVSIRIYNSLGQLVRTLISGETMEAGAHSVKWDGSDERGSRVSSGAYFYSLQAGDFVSTKKSILLK